jgi:hypothetical protein
MIDKKFVGDPEQRLSTLLGVSVSVLCASQNRRSVCRTVCAMVYGFAVSAGIEC